MEKQFQNCCEVDGIVTVDGRGQIVLPKDLRLKAGIKEGDKLAVMSWESGGAVCCITLQKTEALAQVARAMISPVIGETGKAVE